MVTPTSEKRHIPSSASFTNSPSTSAFPKNAPPPTYFDTICEIVERWPGLEKQVIMREGEKLREVRHRGRSEETVKSGFQNVFSTQSKKENPRIQGWNFGQIDAEGRPTSDKSTCRWLLAGVDPKSVRLWEAPSVPLALGIHESTTARDARYDNDVANDVQEDLSHIRHAAGTEEVEHTPEVPMESATQRVRGLSEGVGNHSNLQVTTSYAYESDPDPRLPQIRGSETTRDHQTPS
jgi:hypothetical protein